MIVPNWKETIVGDEIELLYGKGLPESARLKGDVPVYGSNGIVGFHNVAAVKGPGIIVGRKGSVGEVEFSTCAFWPIDTTYYVNNKAEHNWRFLFYLLSSLGLDRLNSHSAVPGLNRESAYARPCVIPPKPEQEKIAAVLWNVQRSIDAEEKLTRIARELKQAVMGQLFRRSVHNEPANDDTGRHSRTWRVSTLSEVAKLERGRFLHRPRNEPRFYGGNTPFVQTGDVVRSRGWIRNYTQTLNEQGVAISRVFPKNTILITIAANIGFTGVLDFDSACPDSLIGITPSKLLDTWYLEYFLQTQQPDMDRLAPKGTQKNINIQFLSPWPIAFPALAEQREIASILKTIDRKIEVHERKREASQELFNSLLDQLMTGQVRVANVDIDVSEIQS